MAERSHSIPAEGTDVGIIGGLAVALWFLILDTIAGRPLLTPSLLGQVVLMGDPTPDTRTIIFGAILLYTAFHFIVFALLGMGLVAFALALLAQRGKAGADVDEVRIPPHLHVRLHGRQCLAQVERADQMRLFQERHRLLNVRRRHGARLRR